MVGRVGGGREGGMEGGGREGGREGGNNECCSQNSEITTLYLDLVFQELHKVLFVVHKDLDVVGRVGPRW